MKAIETVYNGYRFRSRLEARWAVFFDTLGIKYEYEKEGFDLDGVRYLPDFWLPVQQWWIEIKGSQGPTTEDWEKCARLAEGSKYPVAVLVGEPGNEHPYINVCLPDWNEARVSTQMFWLQCPVCYQSGISFDRRDLRINCHCDSLLGDSAWIRYHAIENLQHPKLTNAYISARHARFEHGEKGNVNIRLVVMECEIGYE